MKKTVLPSRIFASFSKAAALIFVMFVLSGCATPVGVGYIDQQESYRRLTENVLTGPALSAPTTQILNRTGLAERFGTNPAEVIAAIHKGVPTADETDRLFALAELSFLYAMQSGDRSYYFASSMYAYALIFPKEGVQSLEGSDPRLRTAIDIYNLGITEGFTLPGGRDLDVRGGTYRLPFGELVVNADPGWFRWGPYRLVGFNNASHFSVRGLRNEYRWPGIGAALVASVEHVPGEVNPVSAMVPPGVKIPVTAFIRIEDPEGSLKSGTIRGNLELYTFDNTVEVTVEGRSVPLEFDLSSALAFTLEGSKVYSTETKGFFSGNYMLFRDKTRFKEGIFFMSPYKRGHIPVVFVHGTASSAARWAEMLNELQNDRRFWGRYQFWFFTYNTGNPVLYSGGLMVQGLKDVVRALDPAGRDPALRKMIIIGHSQGGMLTKLAAIDSGTRFWDNVSTLPLDRVNMSPATRKMVKRSVFYRPLPFVKRVIFIATPHRGSYVAGGWIGRLAGKFVSLPFLMLDAVKEVAYRNPQTASFRSLKDLPRSTDNMDPNSEFVKTFSSIPVSPGIRAHSIIPVENPGAPKDKWTDGVVKYYSAHIDGVESELIVHSGHSTQSEPETIEEVRRILLLHVGIK